MFIDINTLGPDGEGFDRSLHLRDLEGPSRERIDDVEIHLSGTIVPAGSGARLDGSVEGTVLLQCSRCLEMFPWKVAARFDLAVRRTEESARPLTEDEAASILVAPEGWVGLEELATEQVYLNLPLKPVCTPGCRGLCPTCGINKNLSTCSCTTEVVDPRLAPLLPFRKKLSGS